MQLIYTFEHYLEVVLLHIDMIDLRPKEGCGWFRRIIDRYAQRYLVEPPIINGVRWPNNLHIDLLLVFEIGH